MARLEGDASGGPYPRWQFMPWSQSRGRSRGLAVDSLRQEDYPSSMTLIITMVHPALGIWQSSDHRVSRGRERYDTSLKHVAMTCVDGMVILAYKGLAELEDRTHISAWVRETIRGEDRSIEGHLGFLVQRAKRDIAGSRRLRDAALVFGAGAIRAGEFCYYEITNLVRVPGPKRYAIARDFSFRVVKVQEPWPFSEAAGSCCTVTGHGSH